MLFMRFLQASWNQGAIPWNFFQLNREYFNEEKGLFSKLDIDKLIPEQWRLHQQLYEAETIPPLFPVFAKPEWGQNAMGIHRLQNEKEYKLFASEARRAKVPYIVQQAARGRREYEVYYLRSPAAPSDYRTLFVTRVVNRSRSPHPINSVYNPDTSYIDLTTPLGKGQLATLWDFIGGIGPFRMARLCLKADSTAEIFQGHFQVVEINLFLPMPLVLLAENVDPGRKRLLIKQLMENIAQLVSSIPKGDRKPVFLKKMLAHYKVKR